MAAPVSRETPTQSGEVPINTGRVVLTAEERQLAASMGITDIEFARQKIRLVQDKKNDPARYAGQR